MINLDKYTEEGIKYQTERKIVIELEEHFRIIRNYIRDEFITSGDTAYKHRGILKEFDSINKLIFKRFNINVKHVYSHTLYAALPIRLNQNNTISPDGKAMYKVLKQTLNVCDSKEDCNSEISEERVRTITNNSEMMSVIKQTLDNAKELEDSFVNGKIEIDLKNAKIKGFKQKYPVYLLCDPVVGFLDLKLTTKEMVAALLHEVGHVFTYIEAVYTLNRRVISTTEYALDELVKSDNVKVDAEYMKKLLKEELDEGDKHNRVFYSNSEQIADLFSARFGLSAALGSLVEKTGDKHVSFLTGLGATLGNLITMPMLILFMLFGATIVAFALLVSAALFIISILTSILIGSNKGRATTYDNDKERVRLLRLELISQLRLKYIPKDELLYHLHSIDRLEDIEKELIDETTTERVSRFLGFNSNNISFHEFDKRTTELINNNVYKHLSEIETKH